MRLYILLFISLVLFNNNVFVSGQISTDNEKTKRLNVVFQQRDNILDMIINKSIPFEQILPRIKRLENLSDENRFWYLKIMSDITAQLQNRDDDDNVTMAIKEIIDKASFLSLENESLNSAERNDVLYCQLRMALQSQNWFRKTDDVVDCVPVLRDKKVERLIELYQLLVTQIDENYNPHAIENGFNVDGFRPPATYNGPYVSGMDMSNVDDKATRESYKQYKEEIAAKLDKRYSQNTVKTVRKHCSARVKQYLIDAYSLLPYRTSELEAMLTKYKFYPAMSKEIIDAVRKVEKEHPDDGFRTWLSNDKLFKTEAKFVSSDSKNVTVEKRDGKQTTVELKLLRKFDQEYVERQLTPKPDKPKTDSSQ
jgi:hypothetical protein